jgi:hypothetical protein
MNERIQQMMLEAGYASPELSDRAQKLADLIIEECIDICIEGTATQMTSNGAAQFIKLRFGIE